MDQANLETYIRGVFAERVGLNEDQLFADGVTLADAISLSPRMTNSIDLMEAFARTANSLRKDHGIRVRLPALPLETPLTAVLKIFIEECERQQAQQATQEPQEGEKVE